MPRLFGTRAGCADDGHLRQRGVQLVQRSPFELQLDQGGWAKRGQQHIGFRQLAVQRFLTFFGFQIRRHHAHALVQLRVGRFVVVAHRVAGGAGWHG